MPGAEKMSTNLRQRLRRFVQYHVAVSNSSAVPGIYKRRGTARSTHTGASGVLLRNQWDVLDHVQNVQIHAVHVLYSSQFKYSQWVPPIYTKRQQTIRKISYTRGWRSRERERERENAFHTCLGNKLVVVRHGGLRELRVERH